MKDIKFRAFHKPSKKLFDVYCFTDIEVMENSFDGVFTSETLPALRQDCELMQYTGLKDSTQFNELTKEEQEDWLKGNKQEDWKGKEIFEGDIIQDINDNNLLRYGEDNNLTPVEFYNGSFGISVIFDGAFVPLYPYDVDGFKFKVVGNIYQNSELLEIKK
jgi:hypothetical protein